MDTLTDALNNGKSDWAKMQKKLLKESVIVVQQPPADPLKEVDQMGGSDIPASAPGQRAGLKNTTDDLRDLTKINIDILSKTPQFKEFVAKNSMIISRQEKNYILNVIKMLKSDEFIKDKGALYKQLDEFIQELKDTIATQSQIIESNIKKFNEVSDESVIRHGRGLGQQFRSLPTVSTLNEFKEMMHFFNAGDFSAHILQHLLPLVPKETFNVLEENDNMDEARKKNVPEILSTDSSDDLGRSEGRKETRGGQLTRLNPEDNKIEIEKFATWLDGVDGIPRRNNMVKALTNILNAVKVIEKENVKLEALEYIKERGEKAAERGRTGALVTNAKLKLTNPPDNAEVAAAANDLANIVNTTNSTEPTKPLSPEEPDVSTPSAQKEPENPPVTPKEDDDDEELPGSPVPVEEGITINESIKPRTKRGPGKIFDIYCENTEQNVETMQDINKKKLQKINEGWKKYSEKKTPNKQKPDDFILLMG